LSKYRPRFPPGIFGNDSTDAHRGFRAGHTIRHNHNECLLLVLFGPICNTPGSPPAGDTDGFIGKDAFFIHIELRRDCWRPENVRVYRLGKGNIFLPRVKRRTSRLMHQRQKEAHLSRRRYYPVAPKIS
jgi:hypothetical protein